MRAWVVLGLAGAVLLASACRRSQGALSPTGYAPKYSGYEIAYHDRARQSLMPPDWLLDNFIGGGDGFKPKKGADYEAELFIDTDDDGTTNNMGVEPIYDLKFTHRRTAGVIWVRSIPLETDTKDKDLRVLADTLVESISGGGYAMVQLGGEAHATNKERRYAAKVHRRAEATLAGKPAYLVTVDVSNVDRLRVDPDSVEARITLVLVRTGATRSYRFSDRQFPLLLLASYANSPQDYSGAEPEFLSLLSRIAVKGSAGFQAQQSADPETAAPPAEVKPPPKAPPPVDRGGLPEGDAGAETVDGASPPGQSI